MYKLSRNGDRVTSNNDYLENFLRNRFDGKEYMSQRACATPITKFLNWLYPTEIVDVTADQIQKYLNDLAWSDIDVETHDAYQRYIMKFILYLLDTGKLNKLTNEDFYEDENFNRFLNRSLYKPKKKLSNKINNIRPEYFGLFIETIIKTEPRIAFPFILSCMSGARTSEILNLAKSDLEPIGPFGIDGFTLSIKDRGFREKRYEYVKSPRNQTAQTFGKLGSELYKQHLKKYTISDNPALVVDKHGNAMSYKAYVARFNVAKRKFIQLLKNSDNPADIAYGNYLESRRWASHIGRGIFSNDVAKNTSNLAEIAGARGDRNLLSPLPYIQAEAVERLGDLVQYEFDMMEDK